MPGSFVRLKSVHPTLVDCKTMIDRWWERRAKRAAIYGYGERWISTDPFRRERRAAMRRSGMLFSLGRLSPFALGDTLWITFFIRETREEEGRGGGRKGEPLRIRRCKEILLPGSAGPEDLPRCVNRRNKETIPMRTIEADSGIILLRRAQGRKEMRIPELVRINKLRYALALRSKRVREKRSFLAGRSLSSADAGVNFQRCSPLIHASSLLPA